MPVRIREILLDNLEITHEDLTIVDGPLGIGDVMELHKLDRPQLKDPPFVSRITPAMRLGESETDIFSIIQSHDLLLHHPYDSFDTIVNFIKAAAHDPNVLAIKQTLYRVGGSSSPVVNTLLEAAANGKQVAVLVELKARFDEENNIEWAKALERAGVHVVYGLIGLKTHAKVALVIRREADGLKRYMHLGTGNYNASTAKIYEDLGLLTCNEDIAIDASNLFNSLTGYSRQNVYRKLLVAPVGLRQAVLEKITREIEKHKKHGNGRIFFKMNALVDPEIIYALYQASQAGVSIDLCIRGICCLRPGVAGISENIRVRSIVGRFLEHSRIYYFANGGREELYLGSADMMQRNLDGRVETLFPIEDPVIRRVIQDRLIQKVLMDTVNSRELQEDGRYVHVRPEPGEPPFDCQEWFLTHPLFRGDSDYNQDAIVAIPSNA